MAPDRTPNAEEQMARGRFSGFVGGWSGTTYKCRECGKLTRETGEGESGCELCRKCFVIASQENEHTDSHDGRMADCSHCLADLKWHGYKIGTEDRWCDSAPAATEVPSA